MKKNIIRLLCLALLLAPKFLFAQQDITGLWKGLIYDDTTKKYIPYEIAISVDNGKLDGYSYATTKDSTGKDQIGVRSIKLKQKGDKIEIQDEDILASTYSIAPARAVRKHMNVVLEIKDSVLIMSGNWSTNWANNNKLHPVTGTVSLKRKNDEWQREPLIKKLTAMHLSQNLSFVQSERRQELAENNVGNNSTKSLGPKELDVEPVVVVPPAAEVSTRKTTVIQSIYFKSDSLMLTLYDNGEVDGDTVSILAGNQLIFAKQGLSEKPVTKALYTKDITDSLVLTLYAENLGSIPPNTGLVIIYDGTKRYEVFFSADLSNNDAIMLRRYKGDNASSQ
jgi:hypothetical protein